MRYLNIISVFMLNYIINRIYTLRARCICKYIWYYVEDNIQCCLYARAGQVSKHSVLLQVFTFVKINNYKFFSEKENRTKIIQILLKFGKYHNYSNDRK